MMMPSSPTGGFPLEDAVGTVLGDALGDGEEIGDFLGNSDCVGGSDVVAPRVADDVGKNGGPGVPPPADPAAVLAVPPSALGGVGEALEVAPSAGKSRERASEPTDVGGRARFASWVRSLPPDALVEFTSSPQQWSAAARKWELSEQPAMKAAR